MKLGLVIAVSIAFAAACSTAEAQAEPTNARPGLARPRVHRLARPGHCAAPRAVPPAAPSAERSPATQVGVQVLARPSAQASAPHDVRVSATRHINGISMTACVGRERECMRGQEFKKRTSTILKIKN